MSYMLVVGSRSMSGAAVELSRTGIFTFLPSNVEGAAFEYTTLQGADSELESVRWFISEPDFLYLALPRILVFDQIRVQVVSDPVMFIEVD